MRQHAKHVNTKMLSLQTAAPVFSIPSLSILQHQNNGKKCFIYVTHLPLLFMMRVTTQQRRGWSYRYCDLQKGRSDRIKNTSEIWVFFAEYTLFENHRKGLFQNCERSELRLHFEWTKVSQKWQKWSILASFWKPEACSQTVLPDRSVLIG